MLINNYYLLFINNNIDDVEYIAGKTATTIYIHIYIIVLTAE